MTKKPPEQLLFYIAQKKGLEDDVFFYCWDGYLAIFLSHPRTCNLGTRRFRTSNGWPINFMMNQIISNEKWVEIAICIHLNLLVWGSRKWKKHD